MFQDIAPYTFCNDYAWVSPEPFDRVLIYDGPSVLVSLDVHNQLHFPSYAWLKDRDIITKQSVAQGIPKADGSHPEAYFLFSVGETAYIRCEVDREALRREMDTPEAKNESWQFMPVGRLHHYGPRRRAFAGYVGYEYDTWYATRRFCGRCGTPLVHDEVERMVKCPHCGLMEFPKLFPAIIVGIIDPATYKVLVSRYANREYKRYALIAGFCEMGETVEQTVHREVMEEVGLKVKNLRYYKSQPWPASSSLLFGFFGELDGSDAITLDEHELEHAEWIDREDLPQEEADYSLTRDMMQVLRAHRENEYCTSAR
ncbi:MAG: NAD(+) diphosphatase [Eggerthellaceae bacterium]